MSRQKFYISLIILAGLLASMGSPAPSTAAPPPPGPKEESLESSWQREHFPDLPEPRLKPVNFALAADHFGYTWDDTQPVAWKDATGGTPIDDLDSKDDYAAGPVQIGFPFKFYENTYSELFVSSNGILTFGSGNTDMRGEVIPQTATPNNLIAAYWEDLAIGGTTNDGRVFYKRGGASPNRFFVIEYFQITHRYREELITFEFVLWENGNIWLQYQEVDPGTTGYVVGIEDADGLDGLPYAGSLSAPLAIHFIRPAPAARVKAMPDYQGSFTIEGESAFLFQVRNTGELGADVFDLKSSSSSPLWQVELLSADRRTPLSDSDGDGQVDTGSLAQGGTITLVAEVKAPEDAVQGNYARFNIEMLSSKDPTQTASVELQSAVPPPFAQIFVDGESGMRISLIWPYNQYQIKVDQWYSGASLGVATTGNRGYFYVWEHNGSVKPNENSPTLIYTDIEYTMLNGKGSVVQMGTKLTDNRNDAIATGFFINDRSPAMATAPDGRTGVVWIHEAHTITGDNKQNTNVFFAVLNTAGELIGNPVNVTQNSEWSEAGTLDVPVHSSPQIAATDDNRFVLTWVSQEMKSEGHISDIWTAVYSSQAQMVRAPKAATSSIPLQSLYYGPTLAGLTGGQALLAYTNYLEADETYPLVFSVLNSQGKVVKAETKVANAQGLGADVTQLKDGQIVIGWTDLEQAQIAFLYLEPDQFQITAGPTVLANPNMRAGSHVSISRSINGRALLTWMDSSHNYYLYYALLNANGGIVTPPMVFYAAKGDYPVVISSFSGQGNAPYEGSWRTYMPVLPKAK